jgi:hypothetical protein
LLPWYIMATDVHKGYWNSDTNKRELGLFIA